MKKVVLFAFNADVMCFIHVLLNALDMKDKTRSTGPALASAWRSRPKVSTLLTSLWQMMVIPLRSILRLIIATLLKNRQNEPI